MKIFFFLYARRVAWDIISLVECLVVLLSYCTFFDRPPLHFAWIIFFPHSSPTCRFRYGLIDTIPTARFLGRVLRRSPGDISDHQSCMYVRTCVHAAFRHEWQTQTNKDSKRRIEGGFVVFGMVGWLVRHLTDSGGWNRGASFFSKSLCK